MKAQTPIANKQMSAKKEMLLFLLIPTAVIALVAAFLWIPSLFAKPKYDFIYSYCPDYSCSYSYTASSSGRVAKDEPLNASNNYSSVSPELYYHDIAKNSSRLLDETAARQYKLDNSNVSPDGYRLEQGSTDAGGFLFSVGSSDNNWYLVNGIKKKTMHLNTGNSWDGHNIKFLGWVEQ